METSHANGIDEPPVTLIRVKVGASEYEPRWSFLAEYLLSTRGITLQDVLVEGNAKGPRLASMLMELLSACIAHQFPPGAVPSAAALASMVSGDQIKHIIPALFAAGRAAGAIVDLPKNEQMPVDIPATKPLKQ